ncbi:phage tail fiber C-terminal domain-containing protein, partial [Escherichia coli]|uniref:phage tail fiber C-terminal domain-containing protein n=1 Tax=Escherichia coli TaxID=562 RepID=UPI003EE217AC
MSFSCSACITAHFIQPLDILESDENGIIPEQDRVITQVVILDTDKKLIQCVVRPLQILR